MTWAPGWYGFDPDSEMCEAWGPNGSEADAKVHPSLDVHPSEHVEIQTFLVLDAAQARQLLAGPPDPTLRAMLEGVDPPSIAAPAANAAASWLSAADGDPCAICGAPAPTFLRFGVGLICGDCA